MVGIAKILPVVIAVKLFVLKNHHGGMVIGKILPDQQKVHVKGELAI
jgi:hypothetical protein